MNGPGTAVVLNRGDYLGYIVQIGETPAGASIQGWSVQDLTDLENRVPFAMGQCVSFGLAIHECASASLERMKNTAT